MMLRFFKGTLLLILLLTLFVFSAQANETIKIGTTLGLTGKYSKMATMNEKGFRLWAETLNQDKGLLGKQIELIIYDDGSDQEKSQKLYKKLILEDKVDLLFGPYSSTISNAILPITEKYKYPLLLSGAASDALWAKGYRYAFGVFIPASRYTVGFLEMAILYGIRDIAIVHADDSFSTNIAEGAKDWSTKFGMEIKLMEAFKKGNRNLIPLAHKIKISKASAVIVCGHFNESVDMQRALKNIWTPKAYFATVGPSLHSFQEQLGKDADLAFSASQWETQAIYRPQDQNVFLKPFIQKYKVSPSYHAAVTFAAGQILQAAIKKTGSLDRKLIRDMLAKMDTMSIIGRYKVDKTGKQIRHFPITIQRQKGKKEIVWPETLATAKPIFR